MWRTNREQGRTLQQALCVAHLSIFSHNPSHINRLGGVGVEHLPPNPKVRGSILPQEQHIWTHLQQHSVPHRQIHRQTDRESYTFIYITSWFWPRVRARALRAPV